MPLCGAPRTSDSATVSPAGLWDPRGPRGLGVATAARLGRGGRHHGGVTLQKVLDLKKKKKGGCVCGRSGTLCREPPARAEGGFPAGDRELASLGKVRVSAGWLTDCLASTCQVPSLCGVLGDVGSRADPGRPPRRPPRRRHPLQAGGPRSRAVTPLGMSGEPHEDSSRQGCRGGRGPSGP